MTKKIGFITVQFITQKPNSKSMFSVYSDAQKPTTSMDNTKHCHVKNALEAATSQNGRGEL